MPTPATLQINLVNQTNTTPVYAFITGLSLANNNALVLLEADGQTLYYPSSPSSTGQPLAANCAIDLGAPGATRSVTIPQIAGGRIWFSVGKPITFLLNPGPALVEPSVSNPSDPNINLAWDFAEFTFNSAQFFGNISYVDFVSLPISLTLNNTSGGVQHVSGMPSNGLTTVVNGLNVQQETDNAGWSNLVVYGPNGQPLRALSPNNGIVGNSNLFANYFTDYVNQVYSQYTSSPLTIDTQASFGNVNGQVANNTLNFGSISFAKPSSADIFSCSSGPFGGTSNQETLAIIPRLAAAFNRSTLLLTNNQPDGATANQYYTNSPTNHYARIVHSVNLDGLGYAFPYDDVTPDGQPNQAGVVQDGSPASVTLAVGGNNAYTGNTSSAVAKTPATNQSTTTGADKNGSATGADKNGSATGANTGGAGAGARAGAAKNGSATEPAQTTKPVGKGMLSRCKGKCCAIM